MKTRNVFLLLIILILSAPGFSVLADDAGPVDGQQSEEFARPKTIDQHLVHLTNLWHDAILKDKQSDAARFYKKINELLADDLKASRAALKEYAQRAVLENAALEREGKNLVDPDHADTAPQVDREVIKRMIGFVRTKEALIESINRANAFSNKYRLLGDYVDLIRRELKLPRIKYAQKDDK